MRRCLFALTMLVACAFAARADEDYLPTVELQSAGLKRYWQLQLPIDPGQIVRDLYLVDDQLYATTEDGYVYAMDAASGAIRWSKRVTSGGYRVLRPCHAGDRVVFVTPATVSQYDRRYGHPIRRFDLRFPAAGPAISDGSHIYLGGLDRRFYCFYVNDDFETWKFLTGGPILATPAIENGVLYVASDDSGLYACTLNRMRRWISRTTGPNTANVVVDENGVYVASQDHSLYLFEKNTGGRRWRARFSSALEEGPITTPEVAYQYSEDDGLVALDVRTFADDERTLWTVRDGRTLLTLHEKNVFALSTAGEVLVIDKTGGEVKQRIVAPGFTLAAPSPANATIYLASSNGRIFCGRPRDAAPLQAADVIAAITEPEKPIELAAGNEPKAEEAAPKPGAALESGSKLPPLGGKSHVTKGFFGESGGKP